MLEGKINDFPNVILLTPNDAGWACDGRNARIVSAGKLT
jgi:hypothetical protein